MKIAIHDFNVFSSSVTWALSCAVPVFYADTSKATAVNPDWTATSEDGKHLPSTATIALLNWGGNPTEQKRGAKLNKVSPRSILAARRLCVGALSSLSIDMNFRPIGKSGDGFPTLARGVRYNDSDWC